MVPLKDPTGEIRTATRSADQAPMSYGIYLSMQSIAGRGPGAALGVIAVAIVGLGTYLSYRLTHRRDAWSS